MFSEAIKIQRSDENGHSSSRGCKTVCVWSSGSWENNSQEFPHKGIQNMLKVQKKKIVKESWELSIFCGEYHLMKYHAETRSETTILWHSPTQVKSLAYLAH